MPRIITVSAARAAEDPDIAALVEELRARADAFIFLSGGASHMAPQAQQQLLGLFNALAILARDGHRIAVGDGGTEAGIMRAAGLARRASGDAFPLLGVAPAPEIPPRGETPVDPHHTHIVAVENPEWDGSEGYWGSETGTMYRIFGRLADGRSSVAVVANGGSVTLSEVEENLRAGRRMLLIEGSGRAADALVSLVRGDAPADPEVAKLRARARAHRLDARPDLFRLFDVTRSPRELADTIAQELAKRTS